MVELMWANLIDSSREGNTRSRSFPPSCSLIIMPKRQQLIVITSPK